MHFCYAVKGAKGNRLYRRRPAAGAGPTPPPWTPPSTPRGGQRPGYLQQRNLSSVRAAGVGVGVGAASSPLSAGDSAPLESALSAAPPSDRGDIASSCNTNTSKFSPFYKHVINSSLSVSDIPLLSVKKRVIV